MSGKIAVFRVPLNNDCILIEDTPENQKLLVGVQREQDRSLSKSPCSDELDKILDSRDPCVVGVVECTAAFLYKEEW